MAELWRDLWLGFRVLRRRPLFSMSAVLTLALGIGSVSAVFVLVNATLLRPLPFSDPRALYRIEVLNQRTGDVSEATSPLDFLDWRAAPHAGFAILGAYQPNVAFNLYRNGVAERTVGARVSDSLFPTLGVTPVFGRTFTASDDDRRQQPTVAIVSMPFAERHFRHAAEAVGQLLTLDAQPYSIVGVMPTSFEFPTRGTEVYVPFGGLYDGGGRGNSFVRVVGRLADGASEPAAEAGLRRVAATLAQRYPDSDLDRSVVVIPLREAIAGSVRPTLLFLFGGAAIVWLIACANVSNLLLVRAATRAREATLRRALGASRARLVRQFVAESTWLGGAGGVVGVLIAAWSLRLYVTLRPVDLPTTGRISFDATVWAFVLAVSVAAGALLGLMPAWSASNAAAIDTLRSGSRTTHAGGRARWVLVAGEIALSLALLVGVGLLIKSMLHVFEVRPGFDARQVLTFDVSLPWTRYDRRSTAQFFQAAVARLGKIPGVETAGATTVLPLRTENNARYFSLEHRPGNEPRDYTKSNHRLISADYFSTLRIPLKEGRAFNTADFQPEAAQVAVVNEAFVRTFLPGRTAVGLRMKMNESTTGRAPWMTIIGVIGDVRHASVETPDAPEVYRPLTQTFEGESEPRMTMVLRTKGDPAALAEPAREAIRAIDPEEPIANVATMEGVVRQAVAGRRFSLMLLGLFGATALGLTLVGVYGVISGTVEQNIRAIGIRLALGASSRHIVELVGVPSALWTGAGLVVGVVAALAAGRVISRLLFDTTPTDFASFAGAVIVVGGVALIASLGPLLRAVHVDPVTILRQE